MSTGSFRPNRAIEQPGSFAPVLVIPIAEADAPFDAVAARVELALDLAAVDALDRGEGLVAIGRDPLGMVASIAIDDHAPLVFARDAPVDEWVVCIGLREETTACSPGVSASRTKH